MTTVHLGDIVEGKTPLSMGPEATVQTAVEAMSEGKKGAILVVAGERLRGIFTERDLLTRVVAARKDPMTTRLEQVMTSKLVVGRRGDVIHTGLRLMVTASCRHLPVVDGDRVVGIVSRRDLMALDIQAMEEEMDSRDPASLFF